MNGLGISMMWLVFKTILIIGGLGKTFSQKGTTYTQTEQFL